MISLANSPFTMHSAPKLFLLSLLFAVSWSIVTGATTTASLAHIDRVPCTASLDPQNVVARQFSNDSAYEVIRCSARIDKNYSFNHPVFDVTFGLSPVFGIFIIRGNKNCSPNKELCWSDFKIRSQVLRQLLLSGEEELEEEENSVNNAGGTSAGRVTHEINFNCEVADASRNNWTTRCGDSGTIRYAGVLKYGQRCSPALNAGDECPRNMECTSNRCLCRQGFLPFELSRDETICVEKASLGQRCNFTRQCKQVVAESICEYDPIGFKICKCLSGFEEASGAQNQLYCAPIRPTQSTTSSSTVATVEQNEVIGIEAKGDEDVLIFNETQPEKEEKDARMSEDSNFKSLLLNLGKTNQIGLIVFGGVILVAILLVAIIIRIRNYGHMNVEENNEKANSNGKSRRANSKDGPLLGAVHRLSDDDEEEIDVRIDEAEQLHSDARGDQLIYYEQESEEMDVDGRSRVDSQAEPYLEAASNRTGSSHSLNHPPANFNFSSAKQSVV